MRATTDRRPLLSKAAAARKLGVSTDAVLEAVRAGRLPVVVLSRRELIPASALDAITQPAGRAAGHDTAAEEEDGGGV